MNKPRWRGLSLLLVALQFGAASNAGCQQHCSEGRFDSNPAELPTREDALALWTTSGTQPGNRARINLVSDYERWTRKPPLQALPRYTGAGDTSIHKAINEAVRLLRSQALKESLALLGELAQDLDLASRARNIGALMEKWNDRFPSQLPVDILESDIPTLLEQIDALADVAIDALDQQLGLADFAKHIQQIMKQAIAESAEAHDYESPEEFLIDSLEADMQESSFIVRLDETLQQRVNRQSVHLAISGLTSVSRIVEAIDTAVPGLRHLEWVLKIDGGDFTSVNQLVLPGQELTLVAAPETGSGPAALAIAFPILFLNTPAPRARLVLLVVLLVSVTIKLLPSCPSSSRRPAFTAA